MVGYVLPKAYMPVSSYIPAHFNFHIFDKNANKIFFQGPSSSPSSTALIHSSIPPSLEIPSTSSEILLASSNHSSNFQHSNFLLKHSPGNHSNSNHSSINSNLDLLPSNSSIFKISGTTRRFSRTFR